MRTIVTRGTPSILRGLEVQPDQRGEVYGTLLDPFDPSYLHAYSRALVVVGVGPVALAGINMQWEHVAYGWALISVEAFNYRISLGKFAKACIEEAHEAASLHRLEVWVEHGRRAAVEWAEVLGFEVEGIRRQHGRNREDRVMMSRIWQ